MDDVELLSPYVSRTPIKISKKLNSYKKKERTSNNNQKKRR